MRKTADLLDALRAITIVPTETPTPSWLRGGAIAPPNEIIACSNGLVHWPRRMLYPLTPAYYVHHAVPFEFEAKAPEPKRWLEFLRELWGDDTDRIEALQEVFGYVVSGDTNQQKIFLFVGPKRSGKGTIARVLTEMIGKHHVTGPTLASFATNFGLQDLVGKALAIIADARLGTRADGSIVTERLLSISGEDTLTVDRKYKEHWTGQLSTRLLILTNELPRFSDSSGALASRFVVLTFSRSFYGRENPKLTAELCAELPAIFNWALDGLERLRNRGHFQQPQTSQDAIRDLDDLAAPVSAFVRDRCVLGSDRSVDRADLYRAYREWSDDRGYPRRNAAVFGRDLKAAHPQIQRSQPRKGDDARADLYVGIDLAQVAQGPVYCSPSRAPANEDGGPGKSGETASNNGADPVPPVPDVSTGPDRSVRGTL